MNGGTAPWRVYKGKSHWNGWFRGTPFGNISEGHIFNVVDWLLQHIESEASVQKGRGLEFNLGYLGIGVDHMHFFGDVWVPKSQWTFSLRGPGPKAGNWWNGDSTRSRGPQKPDDFLSGTSRVFGQLKKQPAMIFGLPNFVSELHSCPKTIRSFKKTSNTNISRNILKTINTKKICNILKLYELQKCVMACPFLVTTRDPRRPGMMALAAEEDREIASLECWFQDWVSSNYFVFICFWGGCYVFRIMIMCMYVKYVYEYIHIQYGYEYH